MPEGDLDHRLAAALHELDEEGVVSVYLFGSHAEGRAHRESDVAGDLAARRGDRFEDYTEAVRTLAAADGS